MTKTEIEDTVAWIVPRIPEGAFRFDLTAFDAHKRWATIEVDIYFDAHRRRHTIYFPPHWEIDQIVRISPHIRVHFRMDDI